MRPRQDFMRLISVPVRILRTHSCKSACRLPTEPFVTSPLKLLRKQSQTGFAVNVRALNYLSTVYNSSTSNGQPSLKFCRFSDTRPLSLTMATTSRNTAPDSKEEHVCSDDHEKPDERDNNCTELQQTGLSDEKKAHPAATSQLSKRAQKKLLRKEKLKELRKAKRAPKFTKNSNPGFNSDIFSETDYYFENGLRKVYPYPYTFSTYAKERWYGRTIQDIFENEFRVDSPDNFRTSVDRGNMRVNANIVGLDYTLKNGDLIEHRIHRHENPVSGTPIEIIEDTPELVVINKPSSIPCHPCGKFRFNSIVFIMGKEFGYANLRNIYRLDRLTSGVLIMGKTARKTKELENQVLHRHVHKEYVARVVGEFPEGETEVNQPLACLSHKLTLWQVNAGGKDSRTTFQRISYNGKTSLVRCIPHTGRTHQIRVHLQYLGHPIVNDPLYNSPSWGPLRGKGGHCDVSHEELCRRIMREHNVGMWHDGENPLFTDRLSAMSQEESLLITDRMSAGNPGEDALITNSPSEMNQQENLRITDRLSENLEENPLITDQLSEVNQGENPLITDRLQGTQQVSTDSTAHHTTDKTKADNDQSGDAHSPVSSPEPKRRRLSTGEEAHTMGNGEKACMGSAGDTLLPAGMEKEHTKPCTSLESTPSRTAESEAVDGMKNAASSERSDRAGEGISVSKEGAGAERKMEGVAQKGFDPERWVVDPRCESCRLKYIDPKPWDLLLYLHAHKYRGPTWGYCAKLPAWAEEDWEEPEDYDKYFN